MEEKDANVRRKSEKRKPPRARRKKYLASKNGREGPDATPWTHTHTHTHPKGHDTAPGTPTGSGMHVQPPGIQDGRPLMRETMGPEMFCDLCLF